jgi:hypothetical protein
VTSYVDSRTRRPQQVARACHTITTRTTEAVRLLLTIDRMTALPSPPRPERLVRAPGRPDPTLATLLAGERTVDVHLDRLATLTRRLVATAVDTYGTPAPDTAALDLLDGDQRPPCYGAHAVEWRRMLEQVAQLIACTVVAVQQGWRDHYDGCESDVSGMAAVDPMADLESERLAQDLEQLARRASRLAAGLAPQPRQVEHRMRSCEGRCGKRLTVASGERTCSTCRSRKHRTKPRANL